jgi:predicted ABC-type ATPase
MLQTLYSLNDSAFREAQQYIISVYHLDITPAEKPVAIIVGAQPGSGKSLLENIALEELRDNAVVCNLDELRDFHPSANKIKSDHEAYYPELTGDYAWRWREGLMDHCVKNRLNFIVEVTFANGADINNIIKRLRENQYQVELKLLAVHPRLSLLGTQVRYEQQKLEEASGRIINKEAHDERYSKLVPSLIQVQSAALYHKMQIYGRNIASDRSSAIDGVHLIATNPRNAVQVFQKVFDQPWPKKMVTFFEQETQKVIRLKEARNTPAEEITKFREEMKAEFISPRQLQQLAKQQEHEQKVAQELKATQERQEFERQRQAEEARQQLRQSRGKDLGDDFGTGHSQGGGPRR